MSTDSKQFSAADCQMLQDNADALVNQIAVFDECIASLRWVIKQEHMTDWANGTVAGETTSTAVENYATKLDILKNNLYAVKNNIEDLAVRSAQIGNEMFKYMR